MVAVEGAGVVEGFVGDGLVADDGVPEEVEGLADGGPGAAGFAGLADVVALNLVGGEFEFSGGFDAGEGFGAGRAGWRPRPNLLLSRMVVATPCLAFMRPCSS